MTYISNADHEYDGRNSSGSHNSVDGPRKMTARVGDTDESYGNAAFDNYCAGCIEKLSNKEKLWE
jgi:hypothetical protein